MVRRSVLLHVVEVGEDVGRQRFLGLLILQLDVEAVEDEHGVGIDRYLDEEYSEPQPVESVDQLADAESVEGEELGEGDYEHKEDQAPYLSENQTYELKKVEIYLVTI